MVGAVPGLAPGLRLREAEPVSDYIFCLRYADADNWQICKDRQIIGVRTSPSGIASAQSVSAGDHIYIWRGGGASKPGAGLIARIVATGPASPARDVPWPDADSYSYVIPMRLEEELGTPIPDSHPGNGKGVRFGIENTDLQKSLRPLSTESVARLRECFHDAAVDSELPPISTSTGWSTDQALIRRVEESAVREVREHLRKEGWREVRDCQRDGCGYDFIYAHGDGRRRLVEVKGTNSTEVRFQLTRLEHQVLSRDPSGRIYVVLDALKAPVVRELDWTEVEELGLRPAAWQVGGPRAEP